DLAAVKQMMALDLYGLVENGAVPGSELVRARQLLDEVIALAEPLTRQDPSNARFMSTVAFSHILYSLVLRLQGDRAGSQRELLENREPRVAFSRPQLAREPENPAWRDGLARAYLSLSTSLDQIANLDSELASAREALAIYEELARREPENPAWREEQALAQRRLATFFDHIEELEEEVAVPRQGGGVLEEVARRGPPKNPRVKKKHARLGR